VGADVGEVDEGHGCGEGGGGKWEVGGVRDASERCWDGALDLAVRWRRSSGRLMWEWRWGWFGYGEVEGRASVLMCWLLLVV